MYKRANMYVFVFINGTEQQEINTGEAALSLHDALPIWLMKTSLKAKVQTQGKGFCWLAGVGRALLTQLNVFPECVWLSLRWP